MQRIYFISSRKWFFGLDKKQLFSNFFVKWATFGQLLKVFGATFERYLSNLCKSLSTKKEGLPGMGGMFPCSLWKFTVVPLFLKCKLRCSPKFTFTEFHCSQKFRSMFPRSPKIFLTVSYNYSHILFFHG